MHIEGWGTRCACFGSLSDQLAGVIGEVAVALAPFCEGGIDGVGHLTPRVAFRSNARTS